MKDILQFGGRTSQLRDNGDLRDLKDSLELGSRTSLLQDSEDH